MLPQSMKEDEKEIELICDRRAISSRPATLNSQNVQPSAVAAVAVARVLLVYIDDIRYTASFDEVNVVRDRSRTVATAEALTESGPSTVRQSVRPPRERERGGG